MKFMNLSNSTSKMAIKTVHPSYQQSGQSEHTYTTPINIEVKQEALVTHSLFNCAYCNETFSSRKELKEHKDRKHPQIKTEHQRTRKPKATQSIIGNAYVPQQAKFTCEYCYKGFDQSHRLKQHQISHREPVYACDQCEKKFKCQYRLKYHKQEHMPGASQTCGVCHKIFPTMIRLQQHQIMHNDKIYQCKECDKGFKCKYRLKYHELNHYHKAYECPICSKRFALPSRLAQHLSIHDDNTPIYQCDVCLKTFKNKYRLKYHRNEHDKSPK